VEDTQNPSIARNVLILRHYNDGRHGAWDNYSCYKGQNAGHMVDKSKTTEPAVEKKEEIKP